ncbi:DUF2249 domain-containing protein [Streptomyces sp. NPDC047000]|uniref:DUF2249 domain-containing protein n=1 Tax=Streptomyces sp. NPDC047000 TaxID=3155474 RepID=UPI0033FD6790
MTAMSDLTLAANPVDAAALAAAEEHHAHLAGELSGRVATLLAAAARDAAAADRIRRGLVTFCDTQLLPHTAAEETTLYAAARRTADGRLLIESLLAAHTRIAALVDALRETGTPLTAASDARALQVLVEEHVAAENGLVLPLLAVTPGVRLAALLTDMHRAFEEEARTAETALTEAAPAARTAPGAPVPEASVPAAPVPRGSVPAPRPAGDGCGGGCTCGETEADVPELDVREIPHALRHATVFGALDAVPVGRSLVLVAPHDPQRLLTQIEQRSRGHFAVQYLQRGPSAWRLLLSHR